MTTLAPAAAATASSRPDTGVRLSFARVLRSEMIKITTLRSTWWALAVAAALSVGISALIAAASSQFAPGYPTINAILSPTQFTMLVAGILGAIVITGEYSTGMIRSTLTAQPRRGAILAAKAIVVSALVALSTAVTYAIAIAVTAPLLSTPIDWADASMSWVPLLFGVLSMVCFALIGLGFGFVVRNGAGAIAATVGVLFVLPIVFSLFTLFGDGWRWLVDLTQYLPMNAASTLSSPGAEDLLPSLLALAVWVIAPVVGGWLILRSRDA
ncbi:ABC transporter permease [Microbacterium sp. NPDC091313]